LIALTFCNDVGEQVLLEAGARTDVRNKDDFTAVELANIQQVTSQIETWNEQTAGMWCT
jgi:hypothetical protein